MKLDIVTIFPGMVRAAFAEGILGRAVERGKLDLEIHDLRRYTDDRHRVVDDVPYGGGPGMVMKAEPFFRASDAIRASRGAPSAIVLTCPQGRPFGHAEAAGFAAMEHLVVLCGRYEGVDERVREHLATHEISIGDYVLSGGELAALVIADAVCRLVPGVVGDEASVAADSFARGLLDCPHYTRPAEVRGLTVPSVLLSGHHAEIESWRRREAVRRTLERRPELLARAALDEEERAVLRELISEREQGAAR